MLAGEETAGAAEAGLDLVGDEQRAVLAAQPLRLREIAVVGHVDALALDRLDDEGGDVAASQRALQRGEIVERHARAVPQQRLEAVAEQSSSPLSDSAPIGQAVEGMLAIDDLGPPGGGAGELDRCLDRLGAGVAEEHFVEVRQARQQPLGQQARQQRDVHLHEARQICASSTWRSARATAG